MKCRGYSGHTIQTKALIPIARSCVIHAHSPVSGQLAPTVVLWTKGAPLLSFKYSGTLRMPTENFGNNFEPQLLLPFPLFSLPHNGLFLKRLLFKLANTNVYLDIHFPNS